MGWLEMEPKIAAALRQSFPDAEEGQILRWAGEIYDSWTPSAALDTLQRNDKPPEKDKDSLNRAFAHLSRAAELLKEVGYHGGKQLVPIAQDIEGVRRRRRFGVSSVEAPLIISEILCELANKIQMAESHIPEDAPSINSAFGDGPGFGRHTGRPRNGAARAVAGRCRNAFWELTGTRATVITNSMDSKASGDFLNMLQNVFAAMDIKASAETWARFVTRQGENPPE
jgi:hypothetical protein